MEDRTLVPSASAGKAMPPTRAECRAAIDQSRGDIYAIKAQIAAADLERQAKRGRMDPRWCHRARTAIRHERQHIIALPAHLQTLPPDRKVGFKDDEAWRAFLDRSHTLHAQRGAA
jgi:hypothetical protein